MRWIVFSGSAGYSGTDYVECISYTDTTDDILDETSAILATENAEYYESAIFGSSNDYYDQQARDTYYDNILEYCGWKEVSEKEFNEIQLDLKK